ncbi:MULTISPECIES: DNA adenine methylase [unclassified Gilliamella]|uniref:DNA adenine methylase n=1 Tax=unclassified Gilliamella TaxID=2685620 RepID=UPI00226A6B51|nr:MULTISPECIES: DNA adenine methylase [unclassified Gilliamella]MCX8587276.1 DNA adenine methylase [Gilliamella sp. B3801]MCX8591969.1 DNA adenine methylase [Gilliamella sp. B3804]
MCVEKIKIRHPLLRYFGGKFRLAPWIISNFPNHSVYVEPFGGAGSVLLRKNKIPREVYNDIDCSVFNLFKILRDPQSAKKLIQLIALTPFHRNEYLNACYCNCSDEIIQASQLLIRSFMSFSSNGIHQKNSGFSGSTKKRGTTDATTWAKIPANLLAIVERLQGVIIENIPAIELLDKHDGPETLFYCDPTYMHATRTTTAGYQYEMTLVDHEIFLNKIKRVEGRVVIFGYNSELYNDMLNGWDRKCTNARAASQRGPMIRTECVWIKR